MLDIAGKSQQARERARKPMRIYARYIICFQVWVSSAQAWLTKPYLMSEVHDKETVSPLKTCKNNSLYPFGSGEWISRKVWKDNARVCAINFQVNSYLTEDNILPNLLERSLQPRSLTRDTSTCPTRATGWQRLPLRTSLPPARHPGSDGAVPGDHQQRWQRQDKQHPGTTFLTRSVDQPSGLATEESQPFQNGCISLSLLPPQFATLYSKLQQMRKVNTQSWGMRCHLPEGSVWHCKYLCRYSTF